MRFLNIIEHQTATGSVSQFCFAMSTKSTLILLTKECTGFCLQAGYSKERTSVISP